ncbi:MAG: hypothetical protein AAFW73_26810, partial [Bacteroidota bacterium]
IRTRFGYSQERFAELFENKNRTKITTYEAGTKPDLVFMMRLEELSQVPIYDILTREVLREEIPLTPNLGTYEKTAKIERKSYHLGELQDHLADLERRVSSLEENR